jgi:NADPH:quinone reductase-like Zn-dependent oxidoreductase
MKAIIYRRYGGSDVLEYVDLPDPKLSQNNVIVRIKATALNPADLALQAGIGDGFMDAWFPVIPGWDLAGIVERVGAGVTEFAPGDHVIGYVHHEILRHGTYAEKASVPAGLLVRKPTALDWGTAAALPLAGLTALRAIDNALPGGGTGETILIHGAAGGVGCLAAQLAILRGARVLGVASSAHHSFLRGLGIEPIERGDGLVERIQAAAPGGVSAILDCAGKGALISSAPLVRNDVRVVSIADGGPGIKSVFARADVAALARLAEQTAIGALKVPIAGSYPLVRAAEAQAAFSVSHAPGKFVLTI